MLMLISPAKTLDFEQPARAPEHTQPEFLSDSLALVDQLKTLAPTDIQDLMGVSQSIAELNQRRFMNFSAPFSLDNAKQAIFAFKGDVYTGLGAATLPPSALAFVQSHLIMLSGLYGILKPLDLMQPYRLEMGTRFGLRDAKNLYEFWGDRITQALNQKLQDMGSSTLLNLASNEYFKAVKPALLNADVVTPVFKDLKNGQYKIISFYAKKARGLMARYVALNQLESPQACCDFDLENYYFVPEESNASTLTFYRDHAPTLNNKD